MSGADGSGSAPLAQTRRKARHYAMQVIYGWQMVGGSASELEAQFRVDNNMGQTDLAYFRALLSGVLSNAPALDAIVAPCLQGRSVDELDKVELALLRLATFELRDRIDVPYKVVINEAVALARKFGATDSYKYINGVLDQVARQQRAVEVNASQA